MMPAAPLLKSRKKPAQNIPLTGHIHVPVTNVFRDERFNFFGYLI
jgi:hypothetical protein